MQSFKIWYDIIWQHSAGILIFISWKLLTGTVSVISSGPPCKDDIARRNKVSLPLSLLGYLKTRIRRRVVNLTPPPPPFPLNPMFHVQIWKWYIIGILLMLYFENLQKKQISKNWFFFKIQLCSKNVCKRKKFEINKTYIFAKLWTMPYQFAKFW